MMTRALAVEWFKLWRLRLFRATVLFGVGLSGLWLVIALWMTHRGAPSGRDAFVSRLTFPGAYEQAFSLAAGFGETFLAITAAAFVANEYSWGTWRLLLPTGLPRWQALAAKWLALLLGAVVFVGLTALLPLLAAPLVAWWLGQPAFTLPETEHWVLHAIQLPLRAVGSLVAPIVLATALTVWTRSQSVASGVTIGAVLGESVLAALLGGLGGWWAELPRFLYIWNAEAIARAPAFGGAPAPGIPSLAEAIPVVFGWTVLLGLLTVWWFVRRDIEVRSSG